jgi:hypothetical protein
MSGEVIRKVVVGDLMSGMCYSVGQVFRGREIVEIFVDEEFYTVHGVSMVAILLVDEKGDVGEVWKRFPLSQCNLEYSIEELK